jgi:hypothetical protein
MGAALVHAWDGPSRNEREGNQTNPQIEAVPEVIQ